MSSSWDPVSATKPCLITTTCMRSQNNREACQRTSSYLYREICNKNSLTDTCKSLLIIFIQIWLSWQNMFARCHKLASLVFCWVLINLIFSRWMKGITKLITSEFIDHTFEAVLTVERRWAITSTVRPTMALSMASWTRCSLSASRAEVAWREHHITKDYIFIFYLIGTLDFMKFVLK